MSVSVKSLMANLVFRSVGINYQTYRVEDTRAVSERSKEVEKREDEKTRAAMRSDLAKLFVRARQSITIVSGGFPDFVYADMQVLGAVLKARQQADDEGRSFTIKVFTGPKPEKKALEEWQKHGIDVKVLDEWREWHFALVDGHNVKLEDRHAPNAEKRAQYILHNYENVRELVQQLDKLEEMASNTNAARI